MIGLAVKFELGRYHANPWGTHVNEAATEWPPSPWRLIRALYATSRTNVSLAPLRTEIDRGLQALIDAPPPRFVLPHATAAHTRHYMPLSSYSPARPGEKSRVLDGFLAVDPDVALEAWWDVAVDAEATDALGELASRLGYLGRSESLCSARMETGAGPDVASAEPVATDHFDGEEWELVDVLCPRRGESLESIAVSVADLRKNRRLVPDGAEPVTYAVRRQAPIPARQAPRREGGPPKLALLRLTGPARPAITEAVVVGQALRSALQSVYGKRNEDAASPTFSGRRGNQPRDDQHRHAHYLSLPDPEGRRIDRLLVWAPEGFQAREVEALAGVRFLSLHEAAEPLRTALAALAGDGELNIESLLGEAHEWRSLTPFGLVRHPKRRAGQVVDSPEDQVARELRLRGFPIPEQIELQPGAWHRFRSHRAGETRLQRTSVLGVRMRFAEPVPGPIALGAFSHYGLGLFQKV